MSILSKPSKKRSQFDIEHVVESMLEIKFFKDISEQHGEETHTECCRLMTYRFLNQEECVFEQGLNKKKKN